MTDETNSIGANVAGSGGGCFRKGTLIQLEGGKSKPIEQVLIGDEILCFDEDGRVSVGKVSHVHFHEKPEPLLRVKFWRGELYITPNHWVLNQYGNFIDIGAMTSHDALVDGMGHLRPILGADIIQPESVYNLTVEPHHTFIANGIRVHNGGYRDRFPTVAGAGGGGKGGGGTRAAIEDPDSLQSKAMVAVIDLLGEGEIGGLVGANQGFAAQSIFFNDTPVQNPDGSLNFQGVSFDYRNGTQNQEPISGFSEVETPFNVGVKVVKDTPSTFSVNKPNTDEVRIVLTFPSLITQDKKNGDIHGTEVQYKFSIAKDAGSFVDVFNVNSEENINSQISASNGGKTVIIDGSIAPMIGPTTGVGFSIKASGTSNGFVKYRVSYWNGSAWIFHSEEFLERKAFAAFAKQQYEESRYVFIENTSKVMVEYITGTVTKFLGATLADVRFEVTSAVRRYKDPILKLVGKSRSRYQRHHTIELPKPASSWRIRLTRITPDSIDGGTSNDLFLDAYTEITKTKLAYPNSALVATRIDSSQFNSIPQRSYLIDGLYIRVPSNYDPVNKTYDGVWNGGFQIAVSNNPAWVLYDLITNKRYGLGSFIPDIYVDKSKLYQIGRYCDELVPDGFGGLEPRFTVNTTFQTRADAYKIISDLCSVFRGMAYWSGGSVSFTQDSPSDPTMVFSQANVVDGTFSYQGSARKDRHSVAHITWNDPAESYKQKIEYVEDAELVEKYGIKKLDLVAFGCTSRGQAHRLGKWALFSEKFESDLVSFAVGLDAALVLPGDVVKIHDPYRSGARMSGRIKGITSTSVVLDSTITLSNSSSQISFRLPDGSFVSRTVKEAPGVYETLTWNSPLAVTPELNTLWLVAEANLQPLLARVISIAQTDDPMNFAIVAVEHNPSKFAAIELDLALEDRPTSLLNPNDVPDPEDLQVIESTYLQAPGVLGQKLHVTWFGSASSYELRYRRTGSNATPWETKSTTNLNVDLEGTQVGEYEFELYSKNYLGKKSKALRTTYVALGKTAGPESVLGFTIQKRITDLLLTWNPNTDIGIKGYEIRVGDSWETGQLVVTELAATSFIHDQSEAGMYEYWIKAIDLGGRESETATRFELWLSAPSAVTGFDCVQNDTRIEFRWNSNPETDVVGYELREGSTWNSSVYIAEVSGTTYNLPASAVTGNRKFWIKAIASPGIYSDFSAFTTTAVAMASNRNVLFVQDEYALGFPGSKFNTEVVANNLTLKSGESYGEYVWGVELPQQYRARNSIESIFDAVISDGTTWQQFSFRWNSAEAKRRWIASGDLGTVDIQYFIAKYVGIGAEYLNAFTLNNKLTAEKAGASIATQVGIQYQLGRFLQGLRVSDFTDVSWNYAIATTFNLTFWAVPKFIEGFQPWWVATRSTGVKLILGYDAVAQEFQLFDTIAPTQKVSIPFTLQPEDRVLVGIIQTTTERKLYIGILNKEVKSAVITKSAIGAFTKFGLVY